MTYTVKPYTLHQAQMLVEDANERAKQRHDAWRDLEYLYRTGSTEGALALGDVPGRIWDRWPALTLDKINLALPYLNVIIAAIVANEPSWVVEPYVGGEEAEAGAKVGEVLLKYYWKRSAASSDLRDATQDFAIVGNGFCKVGWSHIEHEVDRHPDDVVNELAVLLESDRLMADLAGTDPTGVDELAEYVGLTESRVECDEPWVEYVSPYDVLVPVNARRMWETRWVAQRLVLPVDEIKGNPALTGTKDVTPDGSLENRDRYPDPTPSTVSYTNPALNGAGGGSGGGDREVFETATIYEFYDMRARRLLVFQTDTDKALFDGPLPYSHRYPPFVHLRGYHQNAMQFWGFGELENIAAIQHQFNEFAYAQMDNARRAGNKYFVLKAALTEDVRQALETDEPDVAVGIDPPNQAPLNEIVFPVPRAGLPGDVYQAKNDLQSAMQQVLGLNDFMAGGTGANRMSATAAAVVDGVATMRAQFKLTVVEDSHAHVGLLLLLLLQEFMDAQRVVRIAGSAGAAWAPVSADDLRGEFRVSVEGGSTRAVNPATRQQKALQLIQVLIPTMKAEGYDTKAAWRHAIRDLGYDPDVLLAQPAPAPAPPEAPPSPLGGGLGPMPPDAMAGLMPPAPDMMQETVPMEALGGPPVPAAIEGDLAL